jgi:ELWxxDGT repeat protein
MRIKVNDGSNPAGSVPCFLQAMSNYLYFSAMPSAAPNMKLFRSDVAGTVTLAKGATRLTYPGEKLLVGNKLYFCASEPGTGNELYSYDGDTAIRLTDIAAGALNGIPVENQAAGAHYFRNMPAVYNGRIYFCGSSDGASYQLYRFDPATGVASLVHTVNPAGDAKVGNLYVYRNALYFTAFTPATGTELWKYNDTTCVLYADVRPGPRSGMAYHYNASLPETPSYAAFTEFKGDLYFKAQDSAHGYELWRIKGPVSNVGVQQVGFNGNVSVHPNPATSAVTLDLTLQEARKLVIFVYDMSGRQVYSSTLKAYGPGSHQVGLPLQGLSAGQYVYRLNGEGGAAFATGVITKQ